MTRKPLPVKVGSYVMGAAGFNADDWFKITLENLRRSFHGKGGEVGIVTAFQLVLTATIGSLASDPAVASYILHDLLDWEVVGMDFKFTSRFGWHDPLRSVLQNGRVCGRIPADLPATGSGGPGSYTRTITKQLDFVEDRQGKGGGMAYKYARCLPTTFWAQQGGAIYVKPRGTAQLIKGATLGLTALTVDVYAYVLDVPERMVPIGAFVKEGYVVGNSGEVNPSPDRGKYLRLALANGPRFATDEDDLSAYTQVSFGEPGNLVLDRRDVAEFMRQWNEEFSTEPHRTTDAAPADQKEEFRFLDALENASGDLHAVPLVSVAKGHDLQHAPQWLVNKPLLIANNDDRTGLPASVDFVYDRIHDRTADQTKAVIESVRRGAWGKFSPASAVPGMYRQAIQAGLINVERVPLVADCS